MLEQLRINVLDTHHITNCYIIWDDITKEAVIVDPADKEEIIEKKIEELDLKVRYVLLTHAHKDHTIALKKILDKYNVKVIANINEKRMLCGSISDCSDVFGVEQEPTNEQECMFLEDNQEINIGNTTIKMIYTPGHTKGGSCYLVENSNILITGDTLFADCFGRCDLPSSSIEDMVYSLTKLYKNYSDLQIYPGHGTVDVKLSNTYDSVRRILLYSFDIDIDEYLNKGEK